MGLRGLSVWVLSTRLKKAKAIARDHLRLYAQLGDDQSGSRTNTWAAESKDPPAFLPAGLVEVGKRLRVVTAFLVELLEHAATVVMAATAILVEGLDREVRSRSRSNRTSNERQRDNRGRVLMVISECFLLFADWPRLRTW